MADESVRIFHLEMPLRSPFSTAGGTVDVRSVCLVRLGDEPSGWGEAAPFPGQDESMDDVLKAARAGETTPTLRAAFDEASADRTARIRGVSLCETIGTTMREVPISLAVGLDDPVGVVEQACNRGVARFKLKIAPGNVEHVAGIMARFPDLVVGVDANGSFDGETIGELSALRDLDIVYIEQPTALPGSDEAHQLRATTEVPVFVDESVRSIADAERMLALDSVDGVVVKPGRLGWTGAVAVREMANGSGKRWRSSGLLETGVGRANTDILAACPDAFVSDVAPAEWFLEADVTESRHNNGRVTVPSGDGIGVAPDPDLLDRYLVERIDLILNRSGVRDGGISP